MIIPLSFQNFWRVCVNNRIKPLYRVDEENKLFELLVTSDPFSGFYYKCTVAYDEIYVSYSRIHHDWDVKKAIDMFTNTYLIDCTRFGTPNETISLTGQIPNTVGTPSYRKEVSPMGYAMPNTEWDTIRLVNPAKVSPETMTIRSVNENTKHVIGKDKTTGKELVIATMIRRKPVKATISGPIPGTPETRQGAITGDDIRPVGKIPGKPVTYPDSKGTTIPKNHRAIIREDKDIKLIEKENGEFEIVDKLTGKPIANKVEWKPSDEAFEVDETFDPREEAKKMLELEQLELKNKQRKVKAIYEPDTKTKDEFIEHKKKKEKPHGVLEYLEDKPDEVEKGENETKQG